MYDKIAPQIKYKDIKWYCFQQPALTVGQLLYNAGGNWIWSSDIHVLIQVSLQEEVCGHSATWEGVRSEQTYLMV